MAIKAYFYLRFSTDEQAKGDSERRQKELAHDWAAKHGLELVEMSDRGVSAFRGANLTVGRLSHFLAEVKAKKVPKGSFLLLESLDRFSRQHHFTADRRLGDILEAGVKVVTLSDGKVYDNEPDIGDTIMKGIIQSRANEESKMKSQRLRAAWKAKQDRARESGVVLTRHHPAWLEPKPDPSLSTKYKVVCRGFEIIPDRAKIVKQIFQDCVERDLGIESITKLLNKSKVPTFGPSRSWGKSTVYKILRNRACIGEHIPTIDGKPNDDAKPIPKYFPPVVSENVFYQAQARLEKRKAVVNGGEGIGSGPKGENFNNIFADITHCAACGEKMRLRSFGQARRTKSSRVLACYGVLRGMGCTATASWAYEDLEISFLRYVSELDLGEVMGEAQGGGERRQLEIEVLANEGKLVETQKRRTKVFELLTGDDATSFLKDQFKKLDGEVAELEKKQERLQAKHKSIMNKSETVIQSELVSLIARLKSLSGADAFLIRAAIATKLKEIVEEIRVDQGTRKAFGDVPAGRCFTVRFKSGARRVVMPSATDPTKFIGIYHTEEGLIMAGTIRFWLAKYGVLSPTPEQFEEMKADLLEDQREVTDTIPSRSLHKKWKARNLGPDRSKELPKVMDGKIVDSQIEKLVGGKRVR
jgi:DNA invertase Pin-like site-specific DNA recombinase